jgi:hypothetical protein
MKGHLFAGPADILKYVSITYVSCKFTWRLHYIVVIWPWRYDLVFLLRDGKTDTLARWYSPYRRGMLFGAVVLIGACAVYVALISFPLPFCKARALINKIEEAGYRCKTVEIWNPWLAKSMLATNFCKLDSAFKKLENGSLFLYQIFVP